MDTIPDNFHGMITLRIPVAVFLKGFRERTVNTFLVKEEISSNAYGGWKLRWGRLSSINCKKYYTLASLANILPFYIMGRSIVPFPRNGSTVKLPLFRQCVDKHCQFLQQDM